MKKVLVTGGLGFIGSNLIKLLLKKNYYVINIDKVSYSSNKYNVKEYDNNKNYKFIKLDINSKKLIKIFKRYKPIGIFNLAELLTYKVLYYGKNIPTKEEDIDNINKVTKKDMLNTAKDIFNFNTMSCICSGNIDRKKINITLISR